MVLAGTVSALCVALCGERQQKKQHLPVILIIGNYFRLCRSPS